MLEMNKIYNMDCLEGLKKLDDNSIDSIVTDPPYGLNFMGKKWDSVDTISNLEIWQECLRVLKPGGYLLAFGGARTYHHLAMAIEQAGFEIRDQIMWIYGSGFPKSLDISKAIDKMYGAEREVICENPNSRVNKPKKDIYSAGIRGKQAYITAPATSEAKQWQGWGTALKPAHEPIVVARKPLSEKTVAKNVLKWRTGGINIDGCRVPLQEKGEDKQELGRFPANIILDEEAGKMLDKQSNSASRFFYCAKASKKERTMGGQVKNKHPTVKPLDLMCYLVRLVTPPNGIVLDPFIGSGTTALACIQEGMNFIGFDNNEEYIEIAWRRLDCLSI